ncbi:MAG TPA: M13 family metallopeptidase [Steroidobacteraceae bacterium]|nr:M13 family metallopeptidase [Steroidobacteraceae bacterium]
MSLIRTRAACASILSAIAATALAVSATPPHGTADLDLSGMDPSVSPGDDFFRYVNGGWVASTEIPPDHAAWGTAEILIELNTKRTAELIQSAAKASSAEARQVGVYYAAYMDEARIEREGIEPLQAGLARIDAIADRKMLAQALGATLRADVDFLNNTNLHTENLFGLWVAQDLSDPHRYSPFLLQGGLVMPDRDYYLSPAPKMAQIRRQYQAHIAHVLALAHFDNTDSRAARILDLERRIAQAHWNRQDTELVLKGNNHWKATEFTQRAPGLDWAAYFAAAGLGQQTQFVVWQPSAFTGIAALVASQPLETWRDWLRFHYLEHGSPYLPKAFADEYFDFHSRILSGVPEMPPRWKRAVNETNQALGEAVGKLYVERYFPPSEKARAEAMVRNLVKAFAARIDHLDWMTPRTRERAKAKLATLKVGVGYPDHWRSYAGLEVRADDAFGNAERAERFELQYQLRKLGTPVDRSEWVMLPQTVDAVNLPALNAINFPAGILQPPFFDPRRPVEMDYGDAGAVIGHEISHSFDDQGALFDATGALRNWWTPADFAHFQAAGRRLARQFDAYRPFPDIHVNGQQTLSENIADVAGLSVAYDAWQLTLAGNTAPAVADFSAEQLFFLSYGRSWRQKIREAALRRLVVTNGHAPAEYRADTVRNLDPWYAAFKVQPGGKLYLAPGDRVRVW